MEQAVRALLEAVDDPAHPECPPGFDREAFRRRLLALRPVLERVAGRPFVLDDWRGTPFFGDLKVASQAASGAAVALTFSNFGGLFTTSSFGGERLPEDVVTELVAAAERAGFRFVNADELYEEPYSGRNPWFRGLNWWQRFFGVHPGGTDAFGRPPDAPRATSSEPGIGGGVVAS